MGGFSILMTIFDLFLILCEGNALFNDALNTFYLRLYGVGNPMRKLNFTNTHTPYIIFYYSAYIPNYTIDNIYIRCNESFHLVTGSIFIGSN